MYLLKSYAESVMTRRKITLQTPGKAETAGAEEEEKEEKKRRQLIESNPSDPVKVCALPPAEISELQDATLVLKSKRLQCHASHRNIFGH